MPKFKFTQEMLNEKILNALSGREPATDRTAQPNILEKLKAKAGLNRIKKE